MICLVNDLCHLRLSKYYILTDLTDDDSIIHGQCIVGRHEGKLSLSFQVQYTDTVKMNTFTNNKDQRIKASNGIIRAS